MSPEQLTQLPIDQRSDVYTLGTTLWEMTTMRRLFKRDDDSETLVAVRAGLVPDPRARVPTYPESLWNIVHRALARDREDRYPTADALARDLDRFAAAQAGAEDYPALTRGILDALFPGEHEERTKWIRRASTVPGQVRSTPPAPPAVVRSATRPPRPRPRREGRGRWLAVSGSKMPRQATLDDPFDLVEDVIDGQFRVDAVAGEGGLSVVYRGWHQSVAATVAIKCLNLPATLDPASSSHSCRAFARGRRFNIDSRAET